MEIRYEGVGDNMQVGDLVDDGLDNIGIVCRINRMACFVKFPNEQKNDGWYLLDDLELIT